MANDNTLEAFVWPVNEAGELILTAGKGSTNINGYIPTVSIPVDARTGKVRAVFGTPSVETATPTDSLTYYVKEGYSVKFTSNAATGTITKYKTDGSVDFSQNVVSGNTFNYGPYSGTQKFIVTCTAGSIDATTLNSVLGSAQVGTDSNGNIINLSNGDATIGLVIGPFAFSNLPSAALYPGYRAKVSDIGGGGGSLWVSNGTRWLPENGRVTIGSLGNRQTMTGLTETIVKQWLIPASVLQNFDRIRLRATLSKSGTAETASLAIRFGPLGTVADTQIFANTNMSTTNVSMGVDTEFKRLSATSVLRCGVGSIGSSYNAVSTSAFSSATTVSNLDTNPMYLTITLRSLATGAETLALEDAILDMLGYVP